MGTSSTTWLVFGIGCLDIALGLFRPADPLTPDVMRASTAGRRDARP